MPLRKAARGILKSMSKTDIEREITKLPDSELSALLQWLDEHHSRIWDEKIARDAKAGRFNALIEQAKAEYAAGRSKPL